MIGQVAISYPTYFELFYVGYGTCFTNWVSSPNFAFIATEKPRVSAESIYIVIKLSSFYNLVGHFLLPYT